MKPKNLVFLIILLIGFQSLNAQTWTTKQVGISNTFTQRMWFTSSTVGYSTSGDNTGGTGSVLKTTNGGLTWTKYVTTCTNATYDVNFLNANTGFACDFNGVISRTTNAGVNWATVYVNGSSSYLNTMGFFDANIGFSAGFAYFVRTTNGGANWSEFSLTGTMYSNAVLSSTKAVMVGSQTGSDGGVWISTNSGAAWNYTQLAATNILYDVYFADANTGYAAGGGGVAYKTTNGGTNWTALTTGLSNTFQCVNFQNANTGFIAGSAGAVYRTTNGGANFTQCTTVPAISSQTQYDLVFLDANNALMSGSQGAFFRTSDAGITWQTIGNNQQLNAITFVDGNTGFVAGNSSAFQKTTDGGNTWVTFQSLANSVTLNCMDFTDASTGYIGGNTGNLIKTTNGGMNWTALTPGVATNILSLKFLDANTGYYGTTGGGVRITTNGGANWTALTTGASTNMTGLSFPGASTGYLCSTTGIIRKTTNGGTNWTLLTTGVTANLNSIYFIDVNTGWAVGNTGTCIRTTNGGTNWTNFTSATGTTLGLNSVKFGSAAQGIAVGNTGTIIVTTNGGANWSSQTSGTTANLRSAFINQLGTSIFVSGASGTILNSIDQVLPVELTFFSSSVTGRNVKLSWGTVSEQNNSGFEIERMLKGSDTWQRAGFINGSGTTNQAQNYSFDDRNLSSGKYSYRLKQTDYNGNYEYKNLSDEVIIGKPNSFELSQNYPNPFNPSTKITFSIPFDSRVTLKIFDITGKEIRTLMNDFKSADFYTVDFNAAGLPSGIYFCRISAQSDSKDFAKTIKMILSK